MHKKAEGKEKLLLEKAKDILWRKLYDELSEIKEEKKLDRTVFGFFNKCFLMNQFLSKHGYFLKFKRIQKRSFQVCYLTIKYELARKKQIDLELLCIVYDHSYFEDEKAPAPCFLTFIYSELIKFESAGKIKGVPRSKNFFNNIKGILNNEINIHDSSFIVFATQG